VAGYPGDWLERRPGEPASDLDLVVLLLNTLDYLEDPPDRLTDLSWFREVVTDVGRDDIAGSLRARDLTGLRELRESLLAVFRAGSADEAAGLLNRMLLEASAVPEVVVSTNGELGLQVAPDKRGLAALKARLPAALAAQVAQRGLGRLGTCAASPCQCAFVDRTRAETRRFCCGACNDRAAAQLYRQRKRKA
jgi:predicted RNA-binding Zn ribbon-like protein